MALIVVLLTFAAVFNSGLIVESAILRSYDGNYRTIAAPNADGSYKIDRAKRDDGTYRTIAGPDGDDGSYSPEKYEPTEGSDDGSYRTIAGSDGEDGTYKKENHDEGSETSERSEDGSYRTIAGSDGEDGTYKKENHDEGSDDGLYRPDGSNDGMYRLAPGTDDGMYRAVPGIDDGSYTPENYETADDGSYRMVRGTDVEVLYNPLSYSLTPLVPSAVPAGVSLPQNALVQPNLIPAPLPGFAHPYAAQYYPYNFLPYSYPYGYPCGFYDSNPPSFLRY